MKQRLIRLLIMSSLSLPLAVYAEVNKSPSFLKSCDAQWAIERQGHNSHIGKMVCSCVHHLYQQTQPIPVQSEWKSFINKNTPNCITAGLFENTVKRATYEREVDTKVINGICDSSWISLMKTYKSDDYQFDSKKICQCALPGLVQLVTDYDTLTPQVVHAKIIGLANLCDIHKLPTTLSMSKQVITPAYKGVFSLEIKQDKDPELNKLALYLKEHGMLNKIIQAMNQNIKIPTNLYIVTTKTDIGPYYDYSKKTIYLDYTLLSIILSLYDQAHPNALPANKWHYFNNVIRFLLYHELGHAVIDLYRLPVLGQQEDAADALGAIISLNYLKHGYHVLLDSADFFDLMSKSVVKDKSDYWNEHALNEQRYYRLLCYAYGKYPREVKAKLHEYYNKDLDSFIKDRADYCVDEYDMTYRDWMGLLAPYFSRPPQFIIEN